MRPLGTLLALLACLVLPVAVVSTWTQRQVVDTSAFVDAVTPLADDPAVQDAAASAVEQAVLDHADLPTGGAAASLVDPAVRSVVHSQEFATVWRTGAGTAHDQAIAVLADDGSGVVRDDGTISIDLGDVVQPVADSLGAGPVGAAIGQAVADAGVSLDVVDAGRLTHARRAYAVADRVGLWPDLVWLALVGLALLLPGARRRVLGVLGVGTLVMTGLLALALLAGRSVATTALAAGQDTGQDTGQDAVVRAVYDALAHSLWVSLAVIAVAAVAVLLLRLILGRAPRPASTT